MDTLSLAGKVAIITGSGRESGIGAGVARALARNGAWVVINHVSEGTAPRAAKVAESINQTTDGKAIVVRADVTTPEGAQTLVEETLKQFEVDHINILGMCSIYIYMKELLQFHIAHADHASQLTMQQLGDRTPFLQFPRTQ